MITCNIKAELNDNKQINGNDLAVEFDTLRFTHHLPHNSYNSLGKILNLENEHRKNEHTSWIVLGVEWDYFVHAEKYAVRSFLVTTRFQLS